MTQNPTRPAIPAKVPVNRPTRRSGNGLRHRLPPGQRLICYAALAFLVMLCQCAFIPAGRDTGTRAQYAREYQVSPFELSQRLEGLEKAIAVEAGKPRLHAGVFIVAPSTGKYAELDARLSFPAASIIMPTPLCASASSGFTLSM